MAYEGLSDSSAVPRRVGGTRKMECLRLPLIWRHVFAASHSPISFSRLNRKKENGTNALYVLVGTRILEGRTTRREFRWKYRLRHPRLPLEFEHRARRAAGAPRWFVACKASSVSRIFYDAYIYIYIISIDTPMNRCFHSQILFSFRFSVVFLFVFPSFFFFGSNLYSGLEEKFYFITCYIGFFVNRNEPSRIHPIRIFCIRVINFVSRFYLS